MGAASRLENGWAHGPWGFDSLSFRPFRRSRAARRATVNREAQVRILPPELRRRPVSVAARLADIEQGLVRFQRLRPAMPPWSNGDDARPSTGKVRVRLPPGVLHDLLPVGEQATPPASGAGDRWFDSSQADCAVGERLSPRAS
jgi:hypothetical protein